MTFSDILVKTAWFYCNWLQNDGALNLVHFFLDHSIVYSYTVLRKTWQFIPDINRGVYTRGEWCEMHHSENWGGGILWW